MQNAQISTGFFVNKEENAICLPVAPLNGKSIDVLDNGDYRRIQVRILGIKFYEIGAAASLARIAGTWCIATCGLSGGCKGIYGISAIWRRKRCDQKIGES